MEPATIGCLLTKLSEFKNDTPLGLPYGKFLNGKSGSYRGYYDNLHIGYDDTERANTVGELKSILDDALKRGIMFGYKGGEYEITRETLVWLAEGSHDCSRLMVVGVNGNNYRAGLVVVEQTWM